MEEHWKPLNPWEVLGRTSGSHLDVSPQMLQVLVINHWNLYQKDTWQLGSQRFFSCSKPRHLNKRSCAFSTTKTYYLRKSFWCRGAVHKRHLPSSPSVLKTAFRACRHNQCVCPRTRPCRHRRRSRSPLHAQQTSQDRLLALPSQYHLTLYQITQLVSHFSKDFLKALCTALLLVKLLREGMM